MRWFETWFLIALLQLMVLSLYEMSSKSDDTALTAILAVVGGVPELEAEIKVIMAEASSLRNGISLSKTVHLQVGN
jgi:hypothetical protein